MDTPDVASMLADRGLSRDLRGWAFEPNFDSWRVRVLDSPPKGLTVLT